MTLYSKLGLILTLVAALAQPGMAEEFCVDTEEELQQALDTAAQNEEADLIKVVSDTYYSPLSPAGHFSYYSVKPYGLTIEGDWGLVGGLCTRLSPTAPTPGTTTIDGQSSSRGMHLEADSTAGPLIMVKYLTFTDGSYDAGNHAVAGGLTLQADNGYDPNFVVESNAFVSNSTSGWGGGLNIYTEGTLRVINNFFVFNSASEGSGAAALLSNKTGLLLAPAVEIHNNTVANNYYTGAGSGDGGLHIEGNTSFCNIDNNIFWANEGLDIRIGNENCTLYHNDYEDLGGDIPAANVNPMSVLPSWAGVLNYRLSSNSPLLNKGIVRGLTPSLPDYDLDGLPRFSSDSPVDMGAYEFQYIFYDDFEEGNLWAWSNFGP